MRREEGWRKKQRGKGDQIGLFGEKVITGLDV